MIDRMAFQLRRPVSWISQVSVCISLFTQFAFAQAPSVPNRSEIQLSQSQYASPAVTAGQRSGFTQMVLNYVDGYQSKLWNFQVSANGLAALDGTTENYLAVPELYAQYKGVNPALKISVGRKVESWSLFDQQWKLGLWQPLARWDYLHPQEQGLTGLFVDYKVEGVKLTMFVSGVFLPDQGPNFQLQNGQFKSDNRWFVAPQTRLAIRERYAKINYAVNRPSVESVIQQFSWGAQGVIGDRTSGPWLGVSTAIKPMNQLHLTIDPRYSTSLTTLPQEALAVVNPMVGTHQVTSVEAGFTDDRDWGWISLNRDVPNRPTVPAYWEQAALNTTFFAGVSYARRIEVLGLKRSIVKWSYLKRWDEKSSFTGDSAREQIQSSLQRFDFEQVAGLEWEAQPFDLVTRSLVFSLKYLYSFPEQGGWLSTQFKLGFERNLWVTLGMDVLGAETKATNGLMGRYRSNDRVVGGLTYVF